MIEATQKETKMIFKRQKLCVFLTTNIQYILREMKVFVSYDS